MPHHVVLSLPVLQSINEDPLVQEFARILEQTNLGDLVDTAESHDVAKKAIMRRLKRLGTAYYDIWADMLTERRGDPSSS